MHQKASGGRAPPRAAGELKRFPLAVLGGSGPQEERKWEGRGREKMKGKGGGERKEGTGRKRGGGRGKGKEVRVH